MNTLLMNLGWFGRLEQIRDGVITVCQGAVLITFIAVMLLYMALKKVAEVAFVIVGVIMIAVTYFGKLVLDKVRGVETLEELSYSRYF